MTSPPSMPEDPGERAVTIRVRRTHLWGLVGLLAGLAAGVVIGQAIADDPRPILYAAPPAGATAMSSAAPVRVATAGRPALGPGGAKVTVVEFIDFECPFCRRFARSTGPRLREAYGGRIRYVSRHFPLAIHAHAMDAALAAECAHRLGRFWAYHDVLFRQEGTLDRAGLRRAATRAGLDAARVERCMRAPATRAAVQRDVADGRAYGVSGTPTVFVNGIPLRGALPFDQYQATIDAALDG